MINFSSLIKDGIPFSIENNIVHFILNDDERPWWSKQLEGFYKQSNKKLNMSRNYTSQKQIMTSDPAKNRFVGFISNKRGVKVDLASGPSGYFSAVLDDLTEKDVFVVTDACPTVIAAHSKACNKENVLIFDVDLDKPLPFKDSSVNLFSGNLLSNVNNYAELIREIHRCLKPGGHFAVIDMFFEHGCMTYEHLISKGEFWASFESFTACCDQVGLDLLNSDVLFTKKGKLSAGDLYPLNDNDNWTERTLYFVKR